MQRCVALLRAVNVGRRRVDMATCRRLLAELGYADVGSFVNSGNLVFTASGTTASLERAIRSALETEYGFELATFVRTAGEVRDIVDAAPFGQVDPPHTHFALFPLTPLDDREIAAVQALSNDHDELVVAARHVHWLIRSKSTETTLGPKEWRAALPDNVTTARNMTMLTRLVDRL